MQVAAPPPWGRAVYKADGSISGQRSPELLDYDYLSVPKRGLSARSLFTMTEAHCISIHGDTRTLTLHLRLSIWVTRPIPGYQLRVQYRPCAYAYIFMQAQQEDASANMQQVQSYCSSKGAGKGDES